MCSISTNHTVDTQLEDLERSNDRVMIEKRLYNFAKEADINNPGRLDSPTCRIKRLPDDLKALRKIQIGRHRIYFTGHCNQCSYKTILIKLFKKSDKDRYFLTDSYSYWCFHRKINCSEEIFLAAFPSPPDDSTMPHGG
ncbi:MAG: hypothetical protein HGJ94_19065 [Desulfosarcina sp.]|nr:hypothetical protein [Desulfosarcina sp.]